MNAKIIIATHKLYDMPQDDIYLPVHVGREGKDALPYQPDNTGDNISAKNPSYCELTGLYWAWKNLDCDYLGLAHYRRHFSMKSRSFRKRHTPYAEHLDITREIISEKYPDYLESFDKVMKQTGGYMFNMYIMEKSLSDAYCSWLFDILFELEKRVGDREYSFFQGRFYGRVSEIIFNVWLMNQKEEIKEIPYIHMEEIDWKKKGMAFLKAKFGKKKYEGSF